MERSRKREGRVRPESRCPSFSSLCTSNVYWLLSIFQTPRNVARDLPPPRGPPHVRLLHREPRAQALVHWRHRRHGRDVYAHKFLSSRNIYAPDSRCIDAGFAVQMINTPVIACELLHKCVSTSCMLTTCIAFVRLRRLLQAASTRSDSTVELRAFRSHFLFASVAQSKQSLFQSSNVIHRRILVDPIRCVVLKWHVCPGLLTPIYFSRRRQGGLPVQRAHVRLRLCFFLPAGVVDYDVRSLCLFNLIHLIWLL